MVTFPSQDWTYLPDSAQAVTTTNEAGYGLSAEALRPSL